MQRRTWLQAVVAAAFGTPALKARAAVLAPSSANTPVTTAVAALVDSRWGAAMRHRYDAGGRVIGWDDIPSRVLLSTLPLSGVMVDADGWLRADTCTFHAVTGNEALLAVGVTLAKTPRQLQTLLLGIATPEEFAGLPLTPNGGDINVVWPREGILRVW